MLFRIRFLILTETRFFFLIRDFVLTTKQIVYISEILSNLCMELGNFKEAEYYLNYALSKAFPHYGPLTGAPSLASSLSPSPSLLSPSLQSVDPAYLKLQMARALVLVKSFWFDKGLELLQALERYKDRLSHLDATSLLEAIAVVSRGEGRGGEGEGRGGKGEEREKG
jgi:hypothetical protein